MAQNNPTRSDRDVSREVPERDVPTRAQRVADEGVAEPVQGAAGDANPDPITGEPGSHADGVAIGGVSGAATGALIGSPGGPIGAAIGGIAGAVVGGLIGKGIGEAVDPTEDAYWRDAYRERPYHTADYVYDDYEPAYRLGYNAYDAHEGEYSDSHDAELEKIYEQRRGESRLTWEEARPAVRDAYERRATSRQT